MPLVTSKEMFEKAYNGGYAIGAFNVNNMEIVQGITEACQEEHAPVILQVSKGARAYANHTYLVKLVEAAVECCPDIPIVLHLDHGPDFETCKSCIDGGFTSVMIDASSKPFAENIEITKRVVEYAHDHGVVVEAELGTLAGIEDEVKVAAHEASYTRPEEVEEFVSKTGCDSLAIAIGTSHGAYKFKPEQCTRNEQGILVPPPLRFDVLKANRQPLMAQPLLTPETVELEPESYAAVLDNLPLLQEFGFVCEDFGGGALLVREVPADIDAADTVSTLEEFAECLRTGRSPDEKRENLLHTMACKAAIKGGQRNSPAELLKVAQAVMSGAVKYCPHGRPVAIELTRQQLEKRFGRA